MYICKDEIVKILDVMDKFPEARSFKLNNDTSSGIGSMISLVVQTTVNGVDGEFTVEISNVGDW